MVTRDDLPVSALADAYDLGSWESIEMLPGGKSDHYRLIAGSGEYAITRSHRSKTSASSTSLYATCATTAYQPPW